MPKKSYYMERLEPVMILIGDLPAKDGFRYDIIGNKKSKQASLVLSDCANYDNQQVIIPKCDIDTFCNKFAELRNANLKSQFSNNGMRE